MSFYDGKRVPWFRRAAARGPSAAGERPTAEPGVIGFWFGFVWFYDDGVIDVIWFGFCFGSSVLR